MAGIPPPSLSEMENHLEHYGVKGMRWGVRKDRPSQKSSFGSPEMRTAARAAGKVAFQVGKYGVAPAAAALGLGLPVVAGLGVSARVLSDPDVQAAVASAASYSKSVAKDVGQISMTAVKRVKPSVTIDDFKLKTTSTTRRDPLFENGPMDFEAYGPNKNITPEALNRLAMPKP